MSRSSIYLAGWLTTAVVAVVVIIGMANGAFGAGDEGDATPTPVLTVGPAEQLVSASPTPAGPAPGQCEETVYVYPDGSPAADPSQQASLSSFRGYDDDEDEHELKERKRKGEERHYEDDDDEHEEDDDD